MTATDIIEAARAGDEEVLADLALRPDGRYQYDETTLRQATNHVSDVLRKGFEGRPDEDFPRVVIGWGKCRVGSTAMTNLFGIAGVPAYYQPVKTVLRYLLTGGVGNPWNLPDDRPVLFAKEMAGPYVHCEALFNPVACLVRAGWPASRIQLLVLDREPRASLSSWMNKWAERIGRERVAENYLLSSLSYARMRAYADANGIGVTHCPYEASRAPDRTVERLFTALGLTDLYRPEILTGWGRSGDLNSEHSKVIHPVEPREFVVPGIHGAGDGYLYQTRSSAGLSSAEAAVAEEARAQYEISVRRSVRELDLPRDVQETIYASQSHDGSAHV
ncbi:hypothetical protein AB0K16_45205 [Nonomuraea jabiensis]|uniref:hypothetical protein n=1 Tax=Nonomuraea jabiensis TaxID=882448 RepID=UPI0034455330